MKKTSLFISALAIVGAIFFVSCKKHGCGKGNDCICTKEYAPVCGTDNKTYGNACEADCAGVNHSPGKCATQ